MQKYKVLVLCTGNSARSQMAVAIINVRPGDTWKAVSAGTQPAAHVNPYALRALAEIRIHTEGSTPKHVSTFAEQAFDLVITVCDDAAKLAAFRRVRDEIARRILDALDVFEAALQSE